MAAALAALGLERGGSRTRRLRHVGPGGQLKGFPVLDVEGPPPASAAASWVVEVDGLVETSLRLDRTAWLALPRTQETRDVPLRRGLERRPSGLEGVRVADLLSLAKPQAAGRFVTFHAYAGTYSDSLTLAEAQAPETLLADTLDGMPLPAEHGGPLRLVIPSQLGYKNVKWVVRLEVTASQAQGYWEARGYPADAPVSSGGAQRAATAGSSRRFLDYRSRTLEVGRPRTDIVYRAAGTSPVHAVLARARPPRHTPRRLPRGWVLAIGLALDLWRSPCSTTSPDRASCSTSSTCCR